MLITREAFDPEFHDRKFENRQVRFLMKRLGVADHIPAVARQHRRLERRPGLDFPCFCDCFPGFPVRLIFRALHRGEARDDCRLDAVLRKFRKGVLYRLYKSERDLYWSDTRPFAVVFPFAGTPNGLAVHDGDFGARGGRVVIPDGARTLTLEPFADLIDALVAGGWTPRSVRPGQTVCPPKWGPNSGQVCLTPDLVNLVGGPGGEALVLGLLAGLTLADYRDGSGADCLRARDGVPWVALTQVRAAELTGLSASQVKRASAGLRKRGLVVHRQFLDPDANTTVSHYRVAASALEALWPSQRVPGLGAVTPGGERYSVPLT